MNKRVIFLFFLIYFTGAHLNAQQTADRKGKGASSDGINLNNVLVVNWKSPIASVNLNQIVIAISTKYSPKILGATLGSSLDKLIIEFDPKIISKEDILQVIKSEGILDPYFLEKQKRYYLDNYGFITSDPMKF